MAGYVQRWKRLSYPVVPLSGIRNRFLKKVATALESQSRIQKYQHPMQETVRTGQTSAIDEYGRVMGAVSSLFLAPS
jgi:hypothetical protein